MIITDGTHLVSTVSEQELHEFAQCLGLKREWYQNHPTHPHYDITSRLKLAQAIRLGAVKVTPRDVLEKAWWYKDHWLNKNAH